MALVDGEAAAALAEVARARWLNATTGRHVRRLPARLDRADPWPAQVTPQMTDVLAVREVEALFLDMIAAAKDIIFLENQYFTSDRLGEALAKRLAEDDPPEIVAVTRLLSHGWLEEQTMETLRTRLVKKLREADGKGRFEVYYPHIAGLAEGTCIDVHSTVTVIDEQWLRIGSANFSNRSMGLDTECDLAFEASGDRAQQAAIADFRDGLIAEHLGVSVDEWRATRQARASYHAAIRALRREERTLRPLDQLPEASDAVMAVASAADPERPVSLDRLIEQFSSDEPAPARRRGPAWGKIAAFGLVLLGLALAWRYTSLADYVTAERVREWAHAAGGTWWAPLAVVLAYVPSAFVMFPRPLITIFGVVALGPWLGFAAAITGIALSGICSYYLGRSVKRDTIRRIAGAGLNRMTKLLRRHGLSASFACSIAPVAPFIAVGMAAAARAHKLVDRRRRRGGFRGLLFGARHWMKRLEATA
ncbi:MAG: VTT domain-containing protein [Betaproteobacteria bacterium]